jgi:2-oxoglutarate ferredoxin oxidoreductase subunit gamma
MQSVLIAGSGGQGILFLGKLLAQSVMTEGRNVTWFPSYGAEVRGGTANCMVIISDEMIGSPILKNPDILVVLNEASKERFESRLRQDGLMILDSSLIKKPVARKDVYVINVPATEIAASLGSAKSANMVMLGALISGGKLVSEDSALNALEELTPPRRRKNLDINKRALRKGKAFCDNKEGKSL